MADSMPIRKLEKITSTKRQILCISAVFKISLQDIEQKSHAMENVYILYLERLTSL